MSLSDRLQLARRQRLIEAGVLPSEFALKPEEAVEAEPLDDEVKQRERVMLGLRLDEPLALAGLEDALDEAALARLEALGLAARDGRRTLTLTPRGRFLGGGVTAELLA